MENERNDSRFYTLSKEAYGKMEKLSLLLDKLEKETLNFQKLFYHLGKSRSWRDSLQIIQRVSKSELIMNGNRQSEIYDFCSVEIVSYLKLMDEQLISEIFEKVNRGYKIYIKGIIQYHHEYLLQNPIFMNIKQLEDHSAESTDIGGGQNYIKQMKQDVLSFSNKLNSKFTDISSLLKQKPKPVEKKPELDLLGYMKKVEEERKFQLEKELILKDLDENLDKIKASVLEVNYSGLQNKLNELLVSTTEEPDIRENPNASPRTKRKAREMRNGRVKPQRIIEFIEDRFNPDKDREEQPARQSVILAAKRMADKYTEMDEDFLLSQIKVEEKPNTEYEDNMFEKLQAARKDRDFYKNQTYELEALKNDLKAEVAKLNTLLLESDHRNADLNLSLADLDFRYNQLNKEKNELNKKIGTLEMKLEEAEDEGRMWKYKADKRKKKLEEIKNSKTQADEDKERVAKEKESLLLEITRIKKAKKEADDTIAVLNENIEAQNQLLEGKNIDLQNMDADRAVIKRKLISTEADKKRLESEIKSLEFMLSLKKRNQSTSKANANDEDYDNDDQAGGFPSNMNLGEEGKLDAGLAPSLQKKVSSNSSATNQLNPEEAGEIGIKRRNNSKVVEKKGELGKNSLLPKKQQSISPLALEKGSSDVKEPAEKGKQPPTDSQAQSENEIAVSDGGGGSERGRASNANKKGARLIDSEIRGKANFQNEILVERKKLLVSSEVQTEDEMASAPHRQKNTKDSSTETTDLPVPYQHIPQAKAQESNQEETIRYAPKRHKSEATQTEQENLWRRLVDEHGEEKAKSHLASYIKRNAQGAVISRDNSGNARKSTPLLLENISFDQSLINKNEFLTQKKQTNQVKSVNFTNISNTPTNDSLHLFTEENSRAGDLINEGKRINKLSTKRKKYMASLPNFTEHHNENAQAMFRRHKMTEILTHKFEASTLISGVSLLGSRPAVLQIENFASDESEEETLISKEELMKEVFKSLEVKALRKLSKGKSSGEFVDLIRQMVGAQAEEGQEVNIPDYATFKTYFESFVNIHHKCGRNCAHLKRFYKKIGFDYALHKRKRNQVHVSKLNIDRLPRIGKRNF